MKSIETQLGEAFKYSQWDKLLELVRANRSVAGRYLINFFDRKPEDHASVWSQLEGVSSRPTPGMTKKDQVELLTFLIPIALEYSDPDRLPAFMVPGAPLKILKEACKDVHIPSLDLRSVDPAFLPRDVRDFVSTWVFTGMKFDRLGWLLEGLRQRNEMLVGFIGSSRTPKSEDVSLSPKYARFLEEAILAWKKHVDELKEEAQVDALSTNLDLV